MIGLRMRERRKELKMSADELGKKLGKDRSTIYRYENGDIENLPLDILEPIAAALDTTPQYLMGWEPMTEKEQKNSDVIADITDRMFMDQDFLSLVETLSKLDKDQLSRAKEIIGLAFPGIE